MSLDWHEKANYADTSCPKLRCIFLSRFVYLKGPSVDHFMKWSRWAVWHGEQFFVKKKYFPKAKNVPVFQIWEFFHEKYWIMTSEHFHRKIFVKNPSRTVL